ncbi:hypothetical protein WMF43_05745 [Sorangium sp. So ce131]
MAPSCASMCGGRSGRGSEEVLEVGDRVDEHLAGAVEPVVVVAAARAHGLGPLAEVLELLPGALGEQVVGQPHGQLLGGRELLDDLVGLRAQPPQRLGQRGDAVPPQLAVVGEAAADEVEV